MKAQNELGKKQQSKPPLKVSGQERRTKRIKIKPAKITKTVIAPLRVRVVSKAFVPEGN